MPNLVTIIFAILVAPSKSLEAPENAERFRLVLESEQSQHTGNKLITRLGD